MEKFFGCGKSVHKVRDFPIVRIQEKESGKSQASGSCSEDPKKNHLNALCSRGEKE